MSKKCGNITVQISHIVLIYALFLFPLDMPLLHTWQRITLECTFAYMNVYVGVCVGIPPCVFIPES